MSFLKSSLDICTPEPVVRVLALPVTLSKTESVSHESHWNIMVVFQASPSGWRDHFHFWFCVHDTALSAWSFWLLYVHFHTFSWFGWFINAIIVIFSYWRQLSSEVIRNLAFDPFLRTGISAGCVRTGKLALHLHSPASVYQELHMQELLGAEPMQNYLRRIR